MESGTFLHHTPEVEQLKKSIMKSKIEILTVLLLLTFNMVRAESITIKGLVTDSNSDPLSGVSVVVKGNSTGAMTAADGTYSISTDKKGGILVFSFIGYSTVEEKINGRNTINVVMAEDATALQECVVVAYGIQSRSERKSSARIAYDMAAPVASAAYPGGLPGRYNPAFNTEGYAAVQENGFRSTGPNPLSTFSIDVDNASYSNIRRFINQGEIPPVEAVRIEEMINYFRYSYPLPEGKHPFSVSAEMAVCPWNRNNILLKVGLRGKEIDKSELPSSNLVFLVDVSGSMDEPDKLPLLKSALRLLVRELRPEDHVAIVVYAGSAGIALRSTPGSMKTKINGAIDQLQAGGSTAGGAGLKLAYQEAERNFIPGGNNRIILATDGDFNVGESSNGAMERLITEKRQAGVFITVLGFGMGNIKDDKMELIADKGNGNYSYIDNLQEARRVLVREFGGTLFTIAKDVKFQLEFNPVKVSSYRLIGYENRLLNEEDFNDDKKDAGEMGSGHTVTALYELVPARTGGGRPAVDPLKYQKAVVKTDPDDDLGNEYLTIKVRYKDPDSETSRLLSRTVTGPVNQAGAASEDLRFAASVAEFGMLLKNSEFIGTASYESALALAGSARGEDEDGYRSELIRLIKTVRDMQH
jgi:Ca-activated chloride channel family protein